ncbi:MAG: aspartate--tRNA ligase [Patescibacteria group bacterium]
MERTLAVETPQLVGQEVKLQGWVHNHRRLGKMVFIDLRDRTGLVQVLFADDLTEPANQIRPEYVVEITGTVVERKGKGANPNLPTGLVEIHAKSLSVLSEAQTPPFPINDETKAQETNEELRLEYRYLDLRRQSMRQNLALRAKVNAHFRAFLQEQGFTEVETPYLTKGTPEGAREFIVPSRNFAGKFYVLPQSPQQFKQLLMVAGVERYFQIVRCFRDEDQRGDRQPEFTQLDMEMSFVDEHEVMQLVEDMMIALVKAVTPEKHITQVPFPRIPYVEAMAKYNSDKPDIRKDKNDPNELGFCFITDFPLFEYSEEEKKLVPVHHLFTAPKDADLELLATDPAKVTAKQYDLALNGFEVAGGSIRNHKPEVQQQIFNILKLAPEDVTRRFGHMLKAFSYGVPPHGGIAPGIDRLVAILAGVPNIREVIAFPKTGDARDPMMGAPTELPEQQLRDVHIASIKKE